MTITVVSAQPHSSPVFSSPNMDVSSVYTASGQSDQVNRQSGDTASEPSLKQVQQAVEQANAQAAQSRPVKVSFGYEQKLNQLYVQITDQDTGKVVREIPSKDFIKHKLAMREMIGLILDKTA